MELYIFDCLSMILISTITPEDQSGNRIRNTEECSRDRIGEYKLFSKGVDKSLGAPDNLVSLMSCIYVHLSGPSYIQSMYKSRTSVIYFAFI